MAENRRSILSDAAEAFCLAFRINGNECSHDRRLVNKFLLIQRIPWRGRLIMPDGSQRNQCAHWLCRGLSGTAVLSALRGSVSKGNCLSHRLSEIMGKCRNCQGVLQKSKNTSDKIARLWHYLTRSKSDQQIQILYLALCISENLNLS